MNVFVTLFVTSVLLEATHYGSEIDSDQQLTDALNAVVESQDKNMVGNTSRMTFWPQTYSSTTEIWISLPTNLEGIIEFFSSLIQPIVSTSTSKENALPRGFYVTSDFDDTFLNMGLSTLLKDYKNINPKPYQMWLSQNQNLSGIFLTLKKYAYRPFSQNTDSNVIDPRTFYYMRNFIYDAQAKNQTKIALIPTWVINLSEVRVLYYKGLGMPFNVNNVDLAVCTNSLYGITAAVLSGQIEMELFDDDMQLIYESTASLVAWEISHNFSSRPDLALSHYPSVYIFFWTTSRILNLFNQFEKLPLPVFDRVRSMLLTVMKQNGTEYILKRAVQEGQSSTYFNDFLSDLEGKHADDRLCSTAMATITLFYTWTTTNSSIDLDAPTEVRDTIVGSCEWLNQNALSGIYIPMNVFFSGSLKDETDTGFCYPSNVAEFLNGTTLPKDYQVTDEDVVFGVSGVIPEAEYEEMLSQEHYGCYAAVDFHGYSNYNFQFWSSDSFTYSSILLALTQCKTVIL